MTLPFADNRVVQIAISGGLRDRRSGRAGDRLSTCVRASVEGPGRADPTAEARPRRRVQPRRPAATRPDPTRQCRASRHDRRPERRAGRIADQSGARAGPRNAIWPRSRRLRSPPARRTEPVAVAPPAPTGAGRRPGPSRCARAAPAQPAPRSLSLPLPAAPPPSAEVRPISAAARGACPGAACRRRRPPPPPAAPAGAALREPAPAPAAAKARRAVSPPRAGRSRVRLPTRPSMPPPIAPTAVAGCGRARLPDDHAAAQRQLHRRRRVRRRRRRRPAPPARTSRSGEPVAPRTGSSGPQRSLRHAEARALATAAQRPRAENAAQPASRIAASAEAADAGEGRTQDRAAASRPGPEPRP